MLVKPLRLILSLSILATPVVASANWTGKGEAGAAESTANTGAKNTTIALKFDLANEVDLWKHAFGASTLYTSSTAEASEADPAPTNKTSANRWEVHEQSDYKFTPTTFWFGSLRHENDDIGSFEYQSVVASGIGHKFINNEATTLLAQVGVGYKRFKPRADNSDGNVIISGLLDFKQVLTPNTVLLNKLAFESGADNTLIQNDLALQVKMTDVLALAAGYQLRYNTKPGPRKFPVDSGDYAHSDRLLTLNLVYEFK